METKRRWHSIRDLFIRVKSDADAKGFRNLCKFYGMDFGKYDIEELLKMYHRDKHNIIRK